MAHIMIWLRTDDFEGWKAIHDRFADRRRAEYTFTDDHVYQDVSDPKAVMVHLEAEDLDRAFEWFNSDTFREATKSAQVTERAIYVAELRVQRGG